MAPHTTVADFSPDECCGEQFFTFTSAKGELAPHLPRLRLVGQNDLPLVEIFVPCCGESLDIILDTARAACAIDYPTARFCVTVLDDGNSATLHKAIADLCKIWPNLSYHSRGVKPNAKVFAKAGNLNFGLFEIKRPPPPPPPGVHCCYGCRLHADTRLPAGNSPAYANAIQTGDC